MEKFHFETEDGTKISLPWRENVPYFFKIFMEHRADQETLGLELLAAAIDAESETDKKVREKLDRLTERETKVFMEAWSRGDTNAGVASMGESSAS